jgi:EmrB/QacA subfamily drug resistance transporter
VAYVVGIFMPAMDMHVVNVALPTLSRDFNASLTSVEWVVLGYLLSLAVFVPPSGWIGDRIGTRRTFLFALATFTFASACCGAAQSLGELVAARVLQGMGGGLLAPTGTAMLYRAYPPEQRARVTRTLIIPILLGPALAPLLGGAMTEYLSWRWVFLINLPIGIVTLLFTWRHLEEQPHHTSGRLDIRGLVLAGVGLSTLMYAISEGAERGWLSSAILIPGLLGLASLGTFVWLSLRQRDPILRLRLLSDRLFRATNIVIGLSSAAYIGALYLTPIFLQEVHGQTPFGSGATTFLEAIGVFVGSQSLVRLYPRLGPRVMAAIGSLGVMATLLCFTFWIDGGTSLWLIRACIFAMGVFNSATFLAVQSAMFTNISSSDTGHASAIYIAQRQASIAIGVAILTTVVTAVYHPIITAFRDAYLAAAAMAALGGLCALLLIRTRDARATMVR